MKTLLLMVLLVSEISTKENGGPLKRLADRKFIINQHKLFQLFIRPHQLNLNPEQSEIGNAWYIENEKRSYTNAAVVQTFLTAHNQGSLPRDEIFTIFDKKHREELIRLFDLFFFAKDFEVLYKTACWARDHINPWLFVYALRVAVLQRADCKDFILPPLYDAEPFLFLKSTIIQKAYDIRMQGDFYNHVDGVFAIGNALYIPAYYTGLNHTKHPDDLISYFTEDVSLNSFHTYWNMKHPSWLDPKKYNITKERRGELFYYSHQQLVARYSLERLSNGLEDAPMFSFIYDVPIPAFLPSLRYKSGRAFQMRPEFTRFQRNMKSEIVRNIGRRLTDAIDLGFVLDSDGLRVTLKGKEGLNVLAEIVEGTNFNINKYFYGSFYTNVRSLFGHFNDQSLKYGTAPGVFEHYQTALRDPAFYSMYRYVDTLFNQYKERQPHYTSADLDFPGVRIENVEIEKIYTHYEPFDVDLDNVVDVGTLEQAENVNIQARQHRLNHKPFVVKIRVNSDKAVTVMVRIFIGPKVDVYGKEFTIREIRKYMVELDRFPHRLIVGITTIERHSYESSVTVKDKPSFRTLLNQVESGIAGGAPLYIEENVRHCGWPLRLLVPRGKKQGMEFRYFVMLTPIDDKTALGVKNLDISSMPYCGTGRSGQYFDSYPMGYPFDRAIESFDDYTASPNMFFQNVTIIHI